MSDFLDLLLHLQDHLREFTHEHGGLVYGLLFLIVFCETGLVIMPFLPGDSLLFAVGAIAADPDSGLDPGIAAGTLLMAAILGDTVNYGLGRCFGAWAIRKFPRLIKPSYLERTAAFFQRYGGKAIIVARFVPVVRTFAPFVAGSGGFSYRRFMIFNVIGALLWIGLLVPAGWLFGNIPIVEKHFEVVVVVVIAVSLLPLAGEAVRLFSGRGRRDENAVEAPSRAVEDVVAVVDEAELHQHGTPESGGHGG